MESDAELLARYAATSDEAAFAELAYRHGAFVYRVCLRRLGDAHEAEDAAQAAFLVLARRARSIREKARLASWLHGVALRVAGEALRARTRRRRREEEAAMVRAAEKAGGAADAEGREALHRVDGELAALPALQRQAVILRYLEGRSQEEAARIAGCPAGTLGRRASDGIARLRDRLSRRGCALGTLVLAGLLEAEGKAGVPEGLLPSLLAAPKAAVAGATASAAGGKALALAEGALKAMFWAKLKVAALIVAAAMTVTGGARVGLHRLLAQEQAAPRAEEKPEPRPAELTPLPAPDPKARVIRIPQPLVSKTLLGLCTGDPLSDEGKRALLGLNTTARRIGGSMGHWNDARGDLAAVKDGYRLWDRDDAVVDWSRANGIKLMYLLCYTPNWSNVKTRAKYGYPTDPQKPWEMDFCPPDDPAVWKEMVLAIMKRYKGKVQYYEVWNEPNTGFYFQGRGKTEGWEELTRRYVELCRVTHQAAREVVPDIKVYTACPHNDFFGEWLSAVFGKGLADFSDGICLHIYVGPEFIAHFDNWWTKYMATVQEIETRHGKRLPLVVTEYGYNHKANPERAGGFCLAATTAMLGTFKADLLTQFMFYAKEMRGDDAYAVFRGSFEDNVTVRTLRHLYGLFKGSEYRPLDGAWISPDGEYFQKPGVPSTPDTKFHAFDITKPDGSRLAYVAAWRGRWDYGQGKLVDIPDQDVTITIPGPYRSAEEIDARTGELREFRGWRAHKDGVSFSLSLSGIARGQEGWPRAFIFRR